MPKRKYFIAVCSLWLCMILCMLCFLLVIKQLYIRQTVSFLGMVGETDVNAEQNMIDSFFNAETHADSYEKGISLLHQTGYEESGKVIIGSFPGIYIAAFCFGISVLFAFFIFITVRKIKNIELFISETAVWVSDLKNHTENSRISFPGDHAACPLIKAVREYAEETALHTTALLKEKENMNQFMEDVAHQLKTPLSVLRLYIEKSMLQFPGSRMDRDSGLDQIDKMTKLIGDLLTTGRFDSGKIKMKITSNKMSEFTEIVINDLYPLPENKNIQITVDGEDRDEAWYFDTFWLKEAVLNILKNAVEHSSGNADIRLYYKKEANEYIISISNKGTGIDSRDMNSIFNRFAGMNENGTGLGLYISKQILKSHFGDIYAVNNNSREVVFTLRFPVLKGSSFYD